jgi:cytochrome b subunit of formate dehydrogenase
MSQADELRPKPGVAVKTRPRSDFGTFLIHWVMVIALVLAMLTGFRLSADSLNAVFSRWLEPILLQGDVWTIHFISACVMFASASAYALYVARASLFSRNALMRMKLMVMDAPARLKWQGFNVSLHWGFYILACVMMGTGVLLYLGWGGYVVDIHAAVAIALFVYLFIHVIGHFMQGGWAQIFRIFLPAKLVAGPLAKPRPLLIALIIGAATAAATAALDFGTRDTLTITKVATAPKLDGVLDDAAWKNAQKAVVRTQQGSNQESGKGQSTVEIRAVHDGETVFFAFRWQDPSRTIKRLPLIKKADGWHMLHDRADIADETAYYEDKFAVLFSRSDAFGNGGTTHMGPKPLEGKPGALNKRGLHYTLDGTYADVWQWKASRGGHLGKMDDMYFGPPLPDNAGHRAGTGRYSAGYTNDPGNAFYVYNYEGEPPGGFRGPVKVKRLPKDHAAMTAKLGKIDLKPEASDAEGSIWWMFDNETEPYSKELDDKIPLGTIMPSTLITGTYDGDRNDIAAAPKWENGWWTLETRRKLKSLSKFDVDFSEAKPLYMWVSVFDRNQTRHTRHVRPVAIEFKP